MACKKQTTLRRQEIDLLNFSLAEHNRLVKEHCSCPFENTIALDEIRCEDIMAFVNKLGRVDIDDFDFVRFKLEEHIDFLPDGISRCMGQNSRREQEMRVHAVLNHIRKLLGMTKDEYERSYYLGCLEVCQ